jgi:hypothetical protein
MHISVYRRRRQKMPEKTKEIYNKKEMLFYKLSIGFIYGTIAIIGILLLSGLLL